VQNYRFLFMIDQRLLLATDTVILILTVLATAYENPNHQIYSEKARFRSLRDLSPKTCSIGRYLEIKKTIPLIKLLQQKIKT